MNRRINHLRAGVDAQFAGHKKAKPVAQKSQEKRSVFDIVISPVGSSFGIDTTSDSHIPLAI
jgi:hypothetical protein